MKKQFMVIALSVIVPFLSKAQTWTSSSNAVTTTGKVGIGNTAPTAWLEINYTYPFNLVGQPPSTVYTPLRINTSNGSSYGNTFEIKNTSSLGLGGPVTSTFLGVRGDGLVSIQKSLMIGSNPATGYALSVDGLVNIQKSLRIGTTAANGTYANYALSVDGSMIAKQCVIEADSWADFVFNKDYSLPSLNSVEAYVKENNHLPGVPSEAEVKANGVDMGQMNKILMQKVEELTLYMIDLQKENKEIKDQLAQLKDKN